jgi:hypothetical protein
MGMKLGLSHYGRIYNEGVWREGKLKTCSCASTEHHARKAYWGSASIAPLILWLLHEMEVSGQLHAPGIHWIGGWMGPRAVLDAVVERKIPSPRWKSNSRTAIVQPVAQRYTDWAITALTENEVLSRIYGLRERKIQETTGRRKLHIQDLNNLYTCWQTKRCNLVGH